MKRCLMLLVIEELQIKHVLEWLFIRKQEIASFIKDVEEREPSAVGETENRCSHCGNSMEVPLKN